MGIERVLFEPGVYVPLVLKLSSHGDPFGYYHRMLNLYAKNRNWMIKDNLFGANAKAASSYPHFTKEVKALLGQWRLGNVKDIEVKFAAMVGNLQAGYQRGFKGWRGPPMNEEELIQNEEYAISSPISSPIAISLIAISKIERGSREVGYLDRIE